MNSIRLVLSLVASFKWEVHQMDAKSSFLHEDFHEEIYMEQPTSFIQTNSSLVSRLKKCLHGIKQAPRAWYDKMDSFLLETGFFRCHSDNTVYTKKVGKSLILLSLYFDDLILTSSDPNLINHVKSSLKKNFEMTDLEHLHYFLGLQVLQSKEVWSQISVTCTSLEVDATLYHQLVRNLLYLTHTCPDLSFDVGLIARFMQNPLEIHWKASKRILRYVQGTVQFGIHYSAEASPLLISFTDSDWASDPNDRKSITGYVFTLSLGRITWACKKQSAISLSSTEA
eukprot:PITA_28610